MMPYFYNFFFLLIACFHIKHLNCTSTCTKNVQVYRYCMLNIASQLSVTEGCGFNKLSHKHNSFRKTNFFFFKHLFLKVSCFHILTNLIQAVYFHIHYTHSTSCRGSSVFTCSNIHAYLG